MFGNIKNLFILLNNICVCARAFLSLYPLRQKQLNESKVTINETKSIIALYYAILRLF